MKSFILFTLALYIGFSKFSYCDSRVEDVFEVKESKESIYDYKWHFGLGNYFDFPSTYQINSTGKNNDYNLWPVFNWGLTQSGFTMSSFLFQGNLMVSIPKKVGSSDLTRIFFSFEALPGWNFGYWGNLFAGVSFFEQLLYFANTGETQTENSSTFYRPEKSTWVSQEAFIVCYQSLRLFESFYFELKSYTFSLFNESKRINSYVFNVSYQW